MSRMFIGGARLRFLNDELHFDRSRLLELKCRLELLALGRPLFRVHEHDVRTARLKTQRSACWDLDPLLREPHPRDTIDYGRLVDLEAFGHGSSAPDEAIGLRPGVHDRYVPTKHRRDRRYLR